MGRDVKQIIFGKILFLLNGAMAGFLLGLFFQSSGVEQKVIQSTKEEQEKEIVTEVSVSSDRISSPQEDKICYLTFDDGPSKNTIEILELLKDYQAKATFFVIGNSLTPENQGIVERIIREGHSIGLHANNHTYEKFYENENSWQQDFLQLELRLQQDFGIKTGLFRFPGGSACSYMKGNVKEHIAAMHEKGMRCFDWNVSGEDSVGSPTPDLIYQNVMKGALQYNTPVVLLHDSSVADATVEALKEILRQLSSQGYRFETLENRKEYIFRSSRDTSEKE